MKVKAYLPTFFIFLCDFFKRRNQIIKIRIWIFHKKILVDETTSNSYLLYIIFWKKFLIIRSQNIFYKFISFWHRSTFPIRIMLVVDGHKLSGEGQNLSF